MTTVGFSPQGPLGIRPAMVSIASGSAPRRLLDLRRSPRRGRTMVDSKVASDQALVARMVAGDVTAFAALESRMQDCVWTACLAAMSREERLAREGFRAVWPILTAASCQRCSAWSGKGSFETFLTIAVRELLLEWSAGLYQRLKERQEELNGEIEAAIKNEEDTDKRREKAAALREQARKEIEPYLDRANPVFEALFRATIQKSVNWLHRDKTDREDAYQTILLGLFENDCGRLKEFPGSGSFEAFVKTAVDRLLIDDLRRLISRRRPPAAIERLSPLDQSVFKAVYWDEIPSDADRLFAAVGGKHRLATRADVEAALGRVQKAMPSNYVMRSKPKSINAPTASGGEVGDTLPAGDEANPLKIILLVADEARSQAATAALRGLEEKFTDDEDRACFRLLLAGVDKPQQVAKILGVSVESANVIKARVLRRLKASLKEDRDVSVWRAGNREGE
jgi:RNA polymerase sigma factor (sigma-70 family)